VITRGLVVSRAAASARRFLGARRRPGDDDQALRALGLFGALLALHGELHGLCDIWLQASGDAENKGRRGRRLVYVSDGTPITDDPYRLGALSCSESRFGRLAATRHVASYSVGQVLATVMVTRMLGLRIPAPALAAGLVINAGTHWIIDRRAPLRWLATAAGKGRFLAEGTVVRAPGMPPDGTGPGTSLYELDQSLHRSIAIAAAALTTWIITTRQTTS
jgi:hypothetical protein